MDSIRSNNRDPAAAQCCMTDPRSDGNDCFQLAVIGPEAYTATPQDTGWNLCFCVCVVPCTVICYLWILEYVKEEATALENIHLLLLSSTAY